MLGIPYHEIASWPLPEIKRYLAYSMIEPLPDPWEQTATLGHICSGGTIKPQDIKPRYIDPHVEELKAKAAADALANVARYQQQKEREKKEQAL